MDYLNTPLVAGQEVRVYRNLTRDCWSVQTRITGKGWRVVRHAVEVVLEGCTFQVNEAGRQWVLAHRRKTVHAYVYGRFVTVGDGSNAVPEGEINRYVVPVSYNPFKTGHFFEAPYPDRALSFLAGVWFLNGGRVWGRREYEARTDGARPVFCQDCGRHIPEAEDFWFTDWKCPSEIYCDGCGGKHGFPHPQIDPHGGDDRPDPEPAICDGCGEAHGGELVPAGNEPDAPWHCRACRQQPHIEGWMVAETDCPF